MFSRAKLLDCATAVLGVNLISWGLWEACLKHYLNGGVIALIAGVILTLFGVVQYSHWNWRYLSDSIINELDAERKEQDARWGGQEHDDQMHSRFWVIKVESHVVKALTETQIEDALERRKRARERLCKIAAVAVAGIQSIDRRNSKEKHAQT